MSEQLKPLCGVLDNLIARLCYVERKLGMTPPTGSPESFSAVASAILVDDDDEGVHPRLTAYDEQLTTNTWRAPWSPSPVPRWT
jgi:hypothetical protein